MLIKVARNIIQPHSTRVICPNDPDYELPITIVDPQAFTENDMEIIQAMAMHAPKSKFKPGDLATLRDVPMTLKHTHQVLPRTWKVRFVISAWAYELMMISWRHNGNISMDRAIGIIEETKLAPMQYRNPLIFAHGYPHGRYPRTASWLPERCLQRYIFREPNAVWQEIVEEQGAQFYGYDADRIPAAFAFAVSPDDYSSGQNLGRPMRHEEVVTEAACAAGLEEQLFVPIILGQKSKVKALDPDHDVFKEEP